MHYELVLNNSVDKYYRMAYAPVKEFRQRTDAFKYPYLIVLDKNLNKEQEIKIPWKYRRFFNFLSPDGICLLNEDKYDEDEDHMVFDCFRF